MTQFSAAIAAAAERNPMGNGSVRIIPNRILAVDGDGLAYYCAGKDGSEPGAAKQALIDKVERAQRAVGAERVIILLTASGSTKGHRYAIARAKPYQGQRSNSRRPDNWRYLRDFMESSPFVSWEVQITHNAEADDLFAELSAEGHENLVLYTQDKDMRMIPGLHLDWVTHNQVRLKPGEWGVIDNDKVYGRKWFWLQMLHGDTADNIPGLPKYNTTDARGNPSVKPVGEVTAGKCLSEESDETTGRLRASELYRNWYGDRWLVEMIEQACLLWMQPIPNKWDSVFDPGNPLFGMLSADSSAYDEIHQRVKDANAINQLAAQTQDD